MNDIERKLRDLGERTSEAVRHGEVPRGRIVRRARRRRAMVVGMPAVVAVVLAAVVLPRLDLPGGGRGQGRVVELAAVASATEEAGAARLELEMTFDTGDEPATMHGIGVIDFENVRSRVFLEQTDLTGRMEIVAVGSSVFMRFLDEDGVGEPEWQQLEMPNGVPASPALGGDPSDLLSVLKDGSHEVTDLGDETLDGDPVTHYRAEMKDPRLGAPMPGGLRYDFAPMDIWVDEEGRLRRLAFGATSEPGGSIHLDMRLWDFGVRAEIEAPDPEDVSDESPWSSDGSGIGFESSGGVTMIMGEGRIEAPYVEVDTQDPRIIEACVLSGRPVTNATLVHEPSGRLVFVFSPVRSDGHFTGPVPVACVEHPIERADVEALIEEPTEFTLRVKRTDGSTEVVRLTFTASSRGSSTAVE